MLWVATANGQGIQVQSSDDQILDFYNDYHALVIGIGEYDHWRQRPDAVRDAREVSRTLQRHGVTVRLLTDPTLQALRTALAEFADNTGAESQRGLIFYYSGNTRTTTSSDGKVTGWLMPKDAPPPDTQREAEMAQAISTDDIADAVRRMKSRHALFLFDAPLSADALQDEPHVLKPITPASMIPTRQYISAGSTHETGAVQGVFKRFLVKGLNGEADLIHDGVVSASELGLYLWDRVSRTTQNQRQPKYGRIGATGDPGGDFILRLTESEAAPMVARLYVDAHPDSAVIRIMNIKPRFQQGITLKPGRYHLHVAAAGYQSVEQSIELMAGEQRTVEIRLPEAKNVITNSLGMRFVRIQPGRFLMGSPASEPGRSNDETQHRVQLTRRFFMQSTEVAVGQFKQFVQSTGYKTEAEKSGGCWTAGDGSRWTQKPGTSWQKPGLMAIEADLPVNCVTWNDARTFARWLSRKEQRTYRLPTEAEWEYAGRAGVSTPFSTGRCLSTEEANYGKIGYAYQKCTTVFRNKRGRPIKVGLLAPNPWKLYNIHGNVSEWCQDWYGLYPTGSVIDPTGPDSGSERVMRGGHWQADAAGCRSAKRWRFPPNLASDAVGFRLVMIP